VGRVPTTRRLSVENFQGQKDWIDKLLGPLNSFFSDVVALFNKGITQNENCVAQVNSFKVRTTAGSLLQEPISYPVTMRGRPLGVVLWQVLEVDVQTQPILSGVTPLWYLDNENIIVYHLTGLDASKEYSVTLWACGG
jgi:hypothetical protein